MRNLFLIIIKYHAFFLFLLFETIAFYLIVQNNYYHSASFINSSNLISAYTLEAFNAAREYTHLLKVNEQLMEENALLRRKLKESYHSDKLDTAITFDSTYQNQYIFIGAKVINNSTKRRNNYITLNRGARHGVERKMGVVSSHGIVGIIKDVSENYSTVLSVLHKDAKISVKLANTNYFGSLIWEGNNPRQALLIDIPKHVVIKKGDKVLTSGYSVIFPPNFNAGTIRSFEKTEDTDFYAIVVDLSTDFDKLGYAYIVNNLMGAEQQKLESLNTEEKR